MEKPIISIAFASRRAWGYQYFYDSISANTKVPFEIIFVGPNPPTEKMPDNFTHILSNATPCECSEIAGRHATGDYIFPCQDDQAFSDNFLDITYSYIQRLDMDKVMLSFRFWMEPLNMFGDEGMVYNAHMPHSPIIGIIPLFRRDIWLKLHGYDRRFHGTFCDFDMQLRFYEYGMNPFVPPDCFIIETDQRPGKKYYEKGIKKKALFRLHGHAARELLDSLWVKNGVVSTKRLDKVHSFE